MMLLCLKPWLNNILGVYFSNITKVIRILIWVSVYNLCENFCLITLYPDISSDARF